MLDLQTITFDNNMTFEEESDLIKQHFGFDILDRKSITDFLYIIPKSICIFTNHYMKQKWITLMIERNRKTEHNRFDTFVVELDIE